MGAGAAAAQPGVHLPRSQVVGPQKTGKGPWSATVVPRRGGRPVAVRWLGRRRRGLPLRGPRLRRAAGTSTTSRASRGIRHPSPLIQLTATSEDQVDNVYRPLIGDDPARAAAEHLLLVREGFIRIVGHNDDPDLDRIDVVTSSALSRLGNPISFALQDESGLYTETNKMRKVAETQRRGAAGMGGRTMETTNAWDPPEQSVAQTTFESQCRRRLPVLPACLRTTCRSRTSGSARRSTRTSTRAPVGQPRQHRGRGRRADGDRPGAGRAVLRQPFVAGVGAWLAAGLWESAHAAAGCLSRPARHRDLPRLRRLATSTTGRRCGLRRATATSSPRATAPTSARRSGTPQSGAAVIPRDQVRRRRGGVFERRGAALLLRPAPLGDRRSTVGAPSTARSVVVSLGRPTAPSRCPERSTGSSPT